MSDTARPSSDGGNFYELLQVAKGATREEAIGSISWARAAVDDETFASSSSDDIDDEDWSHFERDRLRADLRVRRRLESDASVRAMMKVPRDF